VFIELGPWVTPGVLQDGPPSGRLLSIFFQVMLSLLGFITLFFQWIRWSEEEACSAVYVQTLSGR
jgi:hypothetical protein